MSIEVALIDFPRLQEQIASRLLAEHNVTVHKVGHGDAEARLELFKLALFFWPDASNEAGDRAAERLHELRKTDEAKKVPVVLVTSENGRQSAERLLGKDVAKDILITPLQPHLVSRQLGDLLGERKSQPSGRLDVAWVNPFVEATMDTIKQMAGMECERTGLTIRMDAATRGFISGTMGLSGEAEGFVAVTFDDGVARKIVCKMLQMKVGEETDEDIRDAVGELMNMIAGQAKATLVHTDHSFHLSLPQTIVGGPHTVGQIRGVPVIVIEFKADGDPFEVMVSLVPRKR